MESLYGATRILTLMDSGLTIFGGTIFCMADRDDIRSIQDLKGKAFMAVDKFSLGGWRSAWRELKAQGLIHRKTLNLWHSKGRIMMWYLLF